MTLLTNNGNGNGLKLYYWYTSFYSQRVLMTLYEKNIPFKCQLVTLYAMEHYEPWFLRLNPRGEVPVLVDGVKVIPDSNRIIEYLEDNFTNGEFKNLNPKLKGSRESKDIQKMRDILEHLPIPIITYGSALHPHLMDNPKEPFSPSKLNKMGEIAKNRHVILREVAEKNPEFSEVLLAKADDAEHGHLNLNQSEDAVIQALDKCDSVLAIVEETLASNTEDKKDWWLCGEMFSIADIDLAILLNRLNSLGHERRYWSDGKRPYLEAYWKRIEQRESFKKATYFSSHGMQLSVLRGLLKHNHPVLLTAAFAAGLLAASLVLFRRVQRS